MPPWLIEIVPHIAGAFTLLCALAASGHAILYKDNTRAAVGWVGIIWLVPLLGAFLYVLFGINRIKRKARALRGAAHEGAAATGTNQETIPGDRPDYGDRPAPEERFRAMARLVHNITGDPLLSGNTVKPLVNGDAAYPEMIEAIQRAGTSVCLSTYIFDNDRAGKLFTQALGDAVRRGVAVRVLIDDVGARYSWPPIPRQLRREGVQVARFLPTWVPWRIPFLNLRNHRKILVVDDRVGFTGGMNIRAGHMVAAGPRRPVRDLHFRVEGPVIAHLARTFAADWFFTTGERLQGPSAPPEERWTGPALARGIPDGPDEDYEKLLWTVYGALASARSYVRIVTPYFLPDTPLLTALRTAAIRDVTVDIVIPERPNLPFIGWAATAAFPGLLKHGCRIWLTPPPFDHTKLMVVDDYWALIGSGNWDPRSMQLNFEFNLECYDRELATSLAAMADERMKTARRLTLEDHESRALAVRLRDGIVRLFSPYL